MVIVPLPSAANDHQTANARVLERAGAAVHLPQSDLSAERLEREVAALVDDRVRLNSMADGARARGRPNAAAEIASHVSRLLGSR